MVKVLLIEGTGHCGSTLLDMMISSHPEAFGLGELKVIAENEDYRMGRVPPNDFYGYADPLWTPELMQQLYQHFRIESSWLHRAAARFYPRLLSNRVDIYRTLFAELPGTRLLVDSSKNTRYSRVALHQLRKASGIEPYLIWIWRDPRAVINSYRRKFPQLTVDHFIRDVKRMQSRKSKLYEDIAVKKAFIRYEDLCASPERVLSGLCNLLRIDYHSNMVNYWRHDHHHLAGNSGTKTLVAKYHGIPKAYSDKPWSADFYRGHPLAITLDERWKTELPKDDQTRIAAAFGLR